MRWHQIIPLTKASSKTNIAWHGSPFRFTRFSAAKIGTGQGEAKHGWGIYLSSERHRGAFFATLQDHGTLYEVVMPPGLYIDWDAPLTDQPEAVAAFQQAFPATHPDAVTDHSIRDQFDLLVRRGWRGRDAYKHLAKLLSRTAHPNKKAASLALRQAGVAGITYLGFDNWDGNGVRSYVVFDPARLRIIQAIPASNDGSTS